MDYILDADWVINALVGRRNADVLLSRLAPQRVTISWVTVAEVYEGAFKSANPEAHLASFRVFPRLLRILSLNDPIAVHFA